MDGNLIKNVVPLRAEERLTRVFGKAKGTAKNEAKRRFHLWSTHTHTQTCACVCVCECVVKH